MFTESVRDPSGDRNLTREVLWTVHPTDPRLLAVMLSAPKRPAAPAVVDGKI